MFTLAALILLVFAVICADCVIAFDSSTETLPVVVSKSTLVA